MSSAARWSARCATTASPGWTLPPRLSRRCSAIFLARERYDAGVQVVRALLTAWIAEPAPAVEARALIDRLVRVLQARSPLAADIARSVAFRWFHWPEAQAARAAALAGVPGELRALADMPDGPERERRIAALVDIPEPLDGFLAERVSGPWSAREPMLEVAARWHYGLQDMQSLRAFELAGRPFVVCDYNLEIQPNRASATTAVVTVGRFDELVAGGRLPADLRAQLTAAPEGHVRVADLYLTWADAPASAEERSAALHAALVSSGIADDVRRIVIGVTGGDQGGPRSSTSPSAVASPPAPASSPRTPSSAACTRWWDGGCTCGACRTSTSPGSLIRLRLVRRSRCRTASCCITAWPRTTPTTSGWWRWRRCTGSRSRATPADGSPRSRARETVLAACVDAIGRARHDLDPAGQWLDMNHVWLDIRPVADLAPEDLAAWQRAIAPRVAQAGIEEILVQGRLRRR